MITKLYSTKEEWLADRKGKIGGSSLSDIVVKRGTGEKIGFYQIIADRIAEDPDGENPMERGTRLEEEAIEQVSKIIGKEINTSLVSWARDDNPSITVSPDGFIDDTEAVEIKSLGSAKHIEAIVTNKIPSEYDFQKLQYFIVNDKLEKLYFCLYDPRMPKKHQVKIFEFTRKELEEDIAIYKAYQEEKLAKIDEIINVLTF